MRDDETSSVDSVTAALGHLYVLPRMMRQAALHLDRAQELLGTDVPAWNDLGEASDTLTRLAGAVVELRVAVEAIEVSPAPKTEAS